MGPHPGIVGTVSLALVIASLLVAAPMGGSPSYGSLAGAPQDQYGTAMQWSAMLLLGSAVPLGILTATLYSRLRGQGFRVPGPAIALFGGIGASSMLMLSALVTWTLSHEAIATDPRLTRALELLAQSSGGVAHALGLGLLVAGVAIPGLLGRMLPAPLPWAGLLVAAICEVSVLSLVIAPLGFLTVLGRFAALAWLVVIGFALSRTTGTRTTGSRIATPKETS